MFKTSVLAALVGLATIASILPSTAAFLGPKVPGGNSHSSGSDDDECAYQLNYMNRVTRADISAIAGQSVFLVPVCENGLIGRNDDYGWLFVNGNVDTLRLPIARNRTLMHALQHEGYDEQDVVSLRFGGDNSIVLYVHQRNLR